MLLKICKSWPLVRHTSRLDFVLSWTSTIIPHCCACKAIPSGKSEKSIKKNSYINARGEILYRITHFTFRFYKNLKSQQCTQLLTKIGYRFWMSKKVPTIKSNQIVNTLNISSQNQIIESFIIQLRNIYSLL